MDLNGKKIAILATNGFEQAELEVPRDRLKQGRRDRRRRVAGCAARSRVGTRRIGAAR